MGPPSRSSTTGTRRVLILAGASYQMGVERDPNPGTGIYYALNRGCQADGTPVLDPVRPLETIGHTHRLVQNTHAQLQSLDLLHNGERLLVIATQGEDGFRGYVYRPQPGRLAVEHTGLMLPVLSIEERLLDLDDDGQWEYIISGGETLIASLAPVLSPGGRQLTLSRRGRGRPHRRRGPGSSPVPGRSGLVGRRISSAVDGHADRHTEG